MLKPEEARRPWSVTELARQIQLELRPLAQVFVKGEVSGMKMSAKGHYGFTIKDGQSVVEAFIFQSDARRLAMLPEDGQAFIFRGGGSFEELYAFNLEPVVRAILASRLPVVTALGHTSDRTLSDLAADSECRTPTEAGARVVPRKSDLLARLSERGRRLEREGMRRLETGRQGLTHRGDPLGAVLRSVFTRRLQRLERCRADLARLSPAQQLVRRQAELAERRRRCEAAALRALTGRLPDLDHRRRRLGALSPDAVLARGYSITQDADSGAVLTAASQTGPGRKVRVRLATGRLAATVDQAE